MGWMRAMGDRMGGQSPGQRPTEGTIVCHVAAELWVEEAGYGLASELYRGKKLDERGDSDDDDAAKLVRAGGSGLLYLGDPL